MNLFDFIIELDHKNKVKKINFFSCSKHWFKDDFQEYMIDKNIEEVLKISTSDTKGIVEIENRIFKYQIICEQDSKKIYISEGGYASVLYENALEKVNEGIQIFDKYGYFIYANQASEKMGMYKREEFKHKHLLDIYDLDENYSTTLSVLRTKKCVKNRCDIFKLTNGKNMTTINNSYPVILGDNLLGAVTFERDMTTLKNVEREIFHLENYLSGKQENYKRDLYIFDDIITASKKMKETIHFAKKISLTDSSVLIVGQTGTGKELIAQSIHSFSHRSNKAFIGINCSAIPTNLFESMFFGTEKGAYTGSESRKGFFEMAEGGTLFLDEVNSISQDMQAKLLRVLQDGKVRRIGSDKQISCDVRIITALNEEPEILIEQERLRKDFYYRLAIIKLDIEPLKDRKCDIPLLARYYLNKLILRNNANQLRFTDEVIDLFENYYWPGNVRELNHAIEYAFYMAKGNSPMIEAKHIPHHIYKSSPSKKYNRCYDNNRDDFDGLDDNLSINEQLKFFERKIIQRALNKNDNNITKSAKSLGISRQNMQYRLKKLKMDTNK